MTKWRKRRKLAEERKAKTEQIEEEDLKKWRRLNKSEYEKAQTLKRLKMKGILERERKTEDWRNVRKDLWRKYRIPSNPTEVSTQDIFIVENSAEDIEKNIVEIGEKVKFNLKETMFKERFSDLNKSDYLREISPKPVISVTEFGLKSSDNPPHTSTEQGKVIEDLR